MGGHKSHKEARRALLFYRVHFGLEPPFRVLCDGTLLHFVLSRPEQQIFLKEALPKVLEGKAVICVTECIIRELRSLGPAAASAALFAKRVDRLPCEHKSGAGVTTVSAEQCILASVKAAKKSGTCAVVASHDDELLKKLSEMSNACVISCRSGFTLRVMAPSQASILSAKQAEEKKRSTSLAEKAVLQAMVHPNSSHPGHHRFRRKIPKGPNPLSALKKKPKVERPSDSASSQVKDGRVSKSSESVRRRRKRKRTSHKRSTIIAPS
mmetsp:Transcript_12307/g.26925  ORF Transcript_12307/g.26925 Transcript_12307/m.26925 type:complete len:267 (+) Transcript_12307:44-844(+)